MDKLETAKELFLEGVRLLQGNQFVEAERQVVYKASCALSGIRLTPIILNSSGIGELGIQ